MKFEFFISSAAITAIASLVSAIISAYIAKRTAETTANKEIEKMELKWAREDIVSSDTEFGEMSRAVAKLFHYGHGDINIEQEAIGQIAYVRSKEHGELGQILDELYSAVKNSDYIVGEELLAKAISKKREIKLSSGSDDRSV